MTEFSIENLTGGKHICWSFDKQWASPWRSVGLSMMVSNDNLILIKRRTHTTCLSIIIWIFYREGELNYQWWSLTTTWYLSSDGHIQLAFSISNTFPQGQPTTTWTINPSIHSHPHRRFWLLILLLHSLSGWFSKNHSIWNSIVFHQTFVLIMILKNKQKNFYLNLLLLTRKECFT